MVRAFRCPDCRAPGLHAPQPPGRGYLIRNSSRLASSMSSRSSRALCAPLSGANQLVELDLNRFSVAVLGVLNQKKPSGK